jgi:hypothetical protein
MKTLPVILFLLLGCSTVTPFVFKSDIPFDQSRFQNASGIGIAIFNNSIPGLFNVIRSDCIRFADKQKNYLDLSNKMRLTPNKLNIQNIKELNTNYMDVKYIFAVFEHEPKLKTKHFKNTQVVSEWRYGKQIEKEIEYEYHQTTLEVMCEIMLFELPGGQLVAKAENVFDETKTDKKEEAFPNHTLFGLLENVFDSGGSGSYPHIEYVSADQASDYFYYFLKHIQYDRSIDFGYSFNNNEAK